MGKLEHCLGGKADGSNKRYKEEHEKKLAVRENVEMRSFIQNINTEIKNNNATNQLEKYILKIELKFKEIEEHKKSIVANKTTLQENLFHEIIKKLCQAYWRDLDIKFTAGTNLEVKFD